MKYTKKDEQICEASGTVPVVKTFSVGALLAKKEALEKELEAVNSIIVEMKKVGMNFEPVVEEVKNK